MKTFDYYVGFGGGDSGIDVASSLRTDVTMELWRLAVSW
jgi:hypothetical protein